MILVDNGSAEGDDLMAEFESESRVSIVSTGGNIGSAGGFASGITAAIQRQEHYVLLLDDDNLIGARSLTTAIQFHLNLVGTLGDDRLVVACMRTSNPLHQKLRQGYPASQVYPPAGSFISLDLLQRILRVLRVTRATPSRRSTLPVIPVAPYGGLLLQRTELEHIGGPNPQLTLYEDDTAWTNNFSRRGYRIVLCTDAPIEDADAKWHDDRDGARGPLRLLRAGDSRRLYYSVRNRVLFDFGRASTPGERLRYYLNRTLFLLYVRLAGRSATLAAARRTFFAAVRHGETGRLDLGPSL